MPFRVHILLFFLIFPFVSSAQKVQTIDGEYIYHAPSTVTPEEAQQTAIYRARLTALADAFGTYIYQSNATSVHNNGESSTLNFQSLGGSEVKGEWLGDTRDPEVSIIGYEQNMLIVQARVWGKAREIISAPIDFTAKVLRNGTTPKFESDQFRAGDDLFLYFTSPTSGYLAVYLIDDSDTAYCLLPYLSNSHGRQYVDGNREYVFFSAQCAGKSAAPNVDEFTLTCEKSVEHNFIYVIFSPNEFAKANDVQAENRSLPRKLYFSDFRTWLSKSRIHDPKMAVVQQIITIRK